eukprot:tig00000737_g3805.t1
MDRRSARSPTRAGALAQTLVRGRSFGAAWELLEALERPDSAVGPDAGMYHTMLVSLCAARRLKPARELFYRAAGRGVLLDRASHAVRPRPAPPRELEAAHAETCLGRQALARALRKAGQADEAAEWEAREAPPRSPSRHPASTGAHLSAAGARKDGAGAGAAGSAWRPRPPPAEAPSAGHGRNPKAPPSPSSPRPPRARRPSASPAARSRKNSGPRPAAAAAAPKA